MTSTQIGQGVPHTAGPTPEDESDWEYEYSTTETETFYVTLDLSTADFTAPHKNIISNVRTDYHGNRLTEAERIRRRNAELSPFGSEGENEVGQGGAQQQLDESRPAAEEEVGAPGGNRGEEETDASASAEEFSAEKVQIMELHSPNPVISYKGRVYEGQWSRHVGTELLLTRRDHNCEGEGGGGSGSNNPNPNPTSNTLPALRHLDNGVDLLAASCARITVTQREPERREDTEEGRRRRTRLSLPEEREAMATRIPPPETAKPSRARVDQAHFLARLIALKKRKGETDEVAVLVNGYSRDLVKRSRARKGGRGGAGRGSGRGGRRRRRGAEPGLFDHAAFLQNHQYSAQLGDDELHDSTPTPTPRHWDDLRGAEPGADGVVAGSGSEDENALQEDDNTMMEVDEDDESGSTGDERSGAEDEEEEESGSETSGASDDQDSEAEEMDVDER
ncbi:hypothetical protein DL769_008216 [Monosporascus sp. CRB-8-3]|nr:hypothetical protein DL769_008216 [Monosporascus sp. CRB-8-3]